VIAFKIVPDIHPGLDGEFQLARSTHKYAPRAGISRKIGTSWDKLSSHFTNYIFSFARFLFYRELEFIILKVVKLLSLTNGCGVMKSYHYLSFLICLFLLSCSNRDEKIGTFNLLPAPQEFRITGTSSLDYRDIRKIVFLSGCEKPAAGEFMKQVTIVDDTLNAQIIAGVDTIINVQPEGYLLQIEDNQILITAKDKAGLLYAFMTLEQLMEDAQEQGVKLPTCRIKDFPLLSYRAIHLDLKHHRERIEYYYALLDKLAKYKINGIIAEMEDKLKYELQPEAASEDALSIDEWKKLSHYANERNIKISPLIQGLGHASFILKHEKYKNLRDNAESDWAFNPLNPETYKVQFDLYLDAIKATPHGKYLHIGGDEVHTTGRGSGRSALELQLIWLNKVCDFANRHERIPIFWDDMPLKHAGVYRPMFNTKLTTEEVDKIWNENEHKLLEFLDQFPKNCIYMRWNYSSPQAIGNGKAMEWFRKHGLQVMGATAGQTRWVLMPQNESNMDNMKTFALSSINNGLSGLLLTLWDDDSPHFELYIRGILAFAEYTWSGEQRSKEEIKAAYRHREFACSVSGPDFSFIDRLEEPVAFFKNALLKGNKRNTLRGDNNAIHDLVIDLPDSDKPGEWSKKYSHRLLQAEKTVSACDSIAIQIKKMKSLTKRNSYRLEVYERVNELVKFTSRALLVLKAYDEAMSKIQRSDNLDLIKELPNDFKTVRRKFEEVYARTRRLTKPDNYILDQDHHVHLANQSISFDWQFYAEMLFLQKVESEF